MLVVRIVRQRPITALMPARPTQDGAACPIGGREPSGASSARLPVPHLGHWQTAPPKRRSRNWIAGRPRAGITAINTWAAKRQLRHVTLLASQPKKPPRRSASPPARSRPPGRWRSYASPGPRRSITEQGPIRSGERTGPCSNAQGGRTVASQPPRRRGSAAPSARKFVSASVRLDVATHARVAAAAALAGVDRSAWINEAITLHLQGIVVFDRRKSADAVDPSSEAIGGAEAT